MQSQDHALHLSRGKQINNYDDDNDDDDDDDVESTKPPEYYFHYDHTSVIGENSINYVQGCLVLLIAGNWKMRWHQNKLTANVV